MTGTRPTAAAYAHRIARVVAAMHATPDRKWRLDDLAAIAAFSPFHFHRVYRAVQGETPEETRRRLLMQRAAAELIAGSGEVGKIARRAGYGSVAAFTRAFSASHGQPPVTYRQRRRPTGGASMKQGEFAMKPDVATTTELALRLIGVPHKGSYQNIGAAFERLGALAFGRGIQPTGPMVGIYYDDPDAVAEKDLRSFAALPVGPDVAAGDELEIRELPGGPVASTIHKGTYAELPQAWLTFYRDWLPTSGREPADTPCYEVYLNDPRDTAPSELLTRIVIPLKG